MHGEDQNPAAEIERAYFLGRLQPTHDRHRDVQDNHVWFVFHDGPYRFLPVFRLSHDLPVLASLQDGPRPWRTTSWSSTIKILMCIRNPHLIEARRVRTNLSRGQSPPMPATPN